MHPQAQELDKKIQILAREAEITEQQRRIMQENKAAAIERARKKRVEAKQGQQEKGKEEKHLENEPPLVDPSLTSQHPTMW